MNDLEIKREYVIQPNAISRSIYSAGTYARRMMAMAMALLPLDPEEAKKKNYTVIFSVTDFMKALGLEKGTKTRALVKAAIEECTGNIIKIYDEKTGDYILYTWFQKTILHSAIGREIAWDWDKITMKFNPELAEAIGDFRRQYAKIDLLDFGKLQGRYSIRLYELALSYSGFAGKDGNPPGCWFIPEITIKDLRVLLDIDPSKYKATQDFRVRVIDGPIVEINSAGIGIRIDPEYIRRGRWLVAIRFNCQWIEQGKPRPANPATETEKEEQEIIAAYPEEYEEQFKKALDEIKKKPSLPLMNSNFFDEQAAKGEALQRLRELHPEIQKKQRGKK